MTEADWLAATHPAPMLEFLGRTGSHSVRSLRLFACACVRRIWLKLSDNRSRKVIETIERYVDDAAEIYEVADAAAQASRVKYLPKPVKPLDWLWRVFGLAIPTPSTGEFIHCEILSSVPVSLVSCVAAPSNELPAATCRLAERMMLFDEHYPGAQADIVRDIFESSFRAMPAMDQAWLAANGGVASNLARNIYDARCFDRMPPSRRRFGRRRLHRRRAAGTPALAGAACAGVLGGGFGVGEELRYGDLAMWRGSCSRLRWCWSCLGRSRHAESKR
jgi:hypothetical protein